MNKLLIATNNQHKVEEFKSIFKDMEYDVELICPKDLNCHDEPYEDGLSFEENAYIKANYYFNKFHYPTIADDSGINIKYFNDYPGIHSSRFLKKDSYKERNDLILELMKNVKNRDCIFNCCLCYINESGEVKYFMGTLEGEISFEAKGEFGFGYDPIFYLKEYKKTNAELDKYGKNKISHRHKVVKDFISYVKKQNN